jgi:uncharacterized membrane protein YwaF
MIALNIIIPLLLICIPFGFYFSKTRNLTKAKLAEKGILNDKSTKIAVSGGGASSLSPEGDGLANQSAQGESFSDEIKTFFTARVKNFFYYLDFKRLFEKPLTGILHVLIAIFYVGVFLSFSLLGKEKWGLGTPLHIIGLISTLILPFTLAYLCKGGKYGAKVVTLVIAGLLILSPIVRPIVYALNGGRYAVTSWSQAIPFNLCNIVAFLLLPALLLRNKVLINGLLPLGIFGGLLNNVQAPNAGQVFWKFITWESYFIHALIVVLPIFLLITKTVELNWKKGLWNLAWFTPWFALISFVINPLWNENFNFTASGGATGFVPNGPGLTIFGNEVYPLKIFIVYVAIVTAVTIFYLVAYALRRWASKPFVHKEIKAEGFIA